MRDERMLILSMLQEGKIDADEAASLLEALGGSGSTTGEAGAYDRTGGGSGSSGTDSGTPLWDDVVQRLGKARDKFESALDGARKRVDSARSQAEQSGSSAAEDIDDFFGSVERGLSRVVSDLPDALARLMRFEFSLGAHKEVQWEYEGGFSPDVETVDIAVFTGDGNVTFATSDEESYRVVVNNKVRANDDDEAASIAAEATRWEEYPGGLRLVAGEGRDVRADVQVMLPASRRYRLDAQTADGNITAKDLSCTDIHLNSADGNIRLKDVTADTLAVTSADGNVRVSGDIETLRAATADGVITATYKQGKDDPRHGGDEAGHSRNRGGDRNVRWDLHSSDGSLRINLPTGPEFGHQLDLLSADGSVRVQLPGLEQQMGGGTTARRGVNVETPGFSEKSVRFTVRARTADGSVTVRDADAEHPSGASDSTHDRENEDRGGHDESDTVREDEQR